MSKGWDYCVHIVVSNFITESTNEQSRRRNRLLESPVHKTKFVFCGEKNWKLPNNFCSAIGQLMFLEGKKRNYKVLMQIKDNLDTDNNLAYFFFADQTE